MSTPKQPDESNVERGQVVPPWKRGEKSAATGMTAGEMAKAAGVDSELSNERPSGPVPRGVVSGEYGSSGAQTRAMSSQGGSSQGGAPSSGAPKAGPGPAGPGQGAPGQAGPGPSSPSVPVAKGGPQSAPGQQGSRPGPQQGSGIGPVHGPTQPPLHGPSQPQRPGQSPAGGGSDAAVPVASPEPAKKFVESDTRNIPRDQLAKKDELPDLDAIHHVEASEDGKAAARAQVQKIPSRGLGTPLRAAVQIRRVDPWSVFKVSGVLSVAGFFIWMIAVAILYGVLDGMGIWEQINSSFGTLTQDDGSSSGTALISTGMVFGFSALFGVVAAVLVTGIATISAYIYNVCADMVGGVEVTLADLD